MKTILRIILLSFFLLPIGASVKAQVGWYPQNPNTSNWLNAVHFVDSLTGWTVGDNYTIRKTTDGGQNWFSQSFGQAGDWSDIYFVDANTGWLAGKQGQVYKTTDGGSNWQIQHLSAAWSSIFFSDAQHGWVVGYNGWISATTDGGANWNSQTSGTTNYLNAVYFVDNQKGFIAGNSETLLRTTNGGTTWSAVADDDFYCSFEDVFFVDADTGFVGGDCSIWASTNGGGSNGWSDLWPNGFQGDIKAIHFANSQLGWFCGTQGKIYHTTDGGTNWIQQVSGSSTTLEDIFFADDHNGWAVGWGGELIHTRVGGVGTFLDPKSSGLALTVSPNPFGQKTVLNFHAEVPGTAQVQVLNALGQVVIPNRNWRLQAGENELELGQNFAPGSYFVRLTFQGEVASRLLIRE